MVLNGIIMPNAEDSLISNRPVDGHVTWEEAFFLLLFFGLLFFVPISPEQSLPDHCLFLLSFLFEETSDHHLTLREGMYEHCQQKK
jgi:hypothetical protein